jgi:nucleotide-binding universal stress UspA family protein
MKKMLVGLDGSSREQGVLSAAVALARKTGATIVLCRSVGVPHDLPPESYAIAPQDLPKVLEKVARAGLERLAQDVPGDLLGGIRVLIGTPWQSLERVAQEEDVDLIVIGSHGYSALDRVLGTTAAKVVNHADRAVLVVRAPERFL